jgi:predicted O-methyltransferase YrrM
MKKAFPESKRMQSTLFGLPHEAVKWELLKTAIELGVFDHLVQPATASEVATVLSTHGKNTEFMLNALVAIGCLSKTNERFQNTSTADTHFVKGKDTYIGSSFLFSERWTRPLMDGGLKNLVQNGPLPSKPVNDESIWEQGARASLNFGLCGRAQRLATYVAALPEFLSFKRMLDLGAGPGILGIAVVAAHPSLECVLFDQPAVCKVADEVIVEYGMENRVATFSGDYMNDPIGSGYDFVMANYTLNFYKDRLEQIFEKVYQAINPGGIFMVASDGLARDRTSPAASVISWLSVSLQGNDMALERGEIADAMLRAGFVSTQSQMFEDFDLAAHGPIDITIGRKTN